MSRNFPSPLAVALAVLAIGATARAQEAAPDPVTMEWSVARVLRSHPALEAAAARVRAAGAASGQAWSIPDPMLMIEGFPAYRIGEGAGMLMVSLQQDLPLSSERRLTSEAAQREARATRRDAQGVRLDLTLAARLAYIRLAEAEQTRVRREQELDLSRATAEVVRARVAAGAGSSSGVLDAGFVITEGEAALELTRGEEEAARAALLALAGLPPDTRLPRTRPLALPPEPPPLAELVARALAARPELQALAARRAAADRRARAAGARGMPMITLGAGAMVDAMEAPGIMATFGISLPLYPGSRDAAGRQAEHTATALRADAASLERTLRGEIASTRAALVAARARARIVRERLIPEAHAHHELALIEYARGQTDLFGLLEALRHHVTSGIEDVAATAQAARLQAVLDRVTGLRTSPSEGE